MIEVKDIKKSFDGKVILNGVSANMIPGLCNLVIGTSGSGKTVFMKCMVGLIQPDSGQILYHGKDFIKMSAEDRKEIRFIKRTPRGREATHKAYTHLGKTPPLHGPTGTLFT